MSELCIVVLLILCLARIEMKGFIPPQYNRRILCDDVPRRPIKRDGILAERDKTPWLGLLRVHLSDHDFSRVAVTGIVLVKFNYAIANAHDIARIPDYLLRSQTNAVFTPAKKKLLHYKVGKTLIHRDYEKGIHNTIAIIELLEHQSRFNLIKPICLIDTEKSYVYYENDAFHTFGYTDERGKLDQEVHQLRELENEVCLKYYKRNALASFKLWPSQFYCCEEIYNNGSDVCVYENGMVLASQRVRENDGIWLLLGISARGPGCSAPSRFINITPYMKWILSVLRRDERRLKGSKEILDAKDFAVISRRSDWESGWDAGWEHHLGGNNRDYYKIVDFDRVSDTKLFIFVFNDTYELRKGSCDKKYRKKLIYRENATIETLAGKVGIGAYRISMWDLFIKEYTCIHVEIECEDRSVAQVYYTIGTDEKDDNIDTFDKRYVLEQRNYGNIGFINLYVRFMFRGRAELKIVFYGPKSPRAKWFPYDKDFLIKLLENQFWTNYMRDINRTYLEPRGNFPRMKMAGE